MIMHTSSSVYTPPYAATAALHPYAYDRYESTVRLAVNTHSPLTADTAAAAAAATYSHTHIHAHKIKTVAVRSFRHSYLSPLWYVIRLSFQTLPRLTTTVAVMDSTRSCLSRFFFFYHCGISNDITVSA